MPEGRVLGLWRYPVKSMAGEAVRDARLDVRGMAGDRRYAVYPAGAERSDDDRPLTARETPRLLAWSASYPLHPGASLPADGAPPLPALAGPAGQPRAWKDADLPAVLERELARPVRLVRDAEPIHDVPRTLLITTEASRLALERELGAPVDVRRFRSNLHLELGQAWAELAWRDAVLRVGPDVSLRLIDPCRRCVIPTRDLRTQRKWPELLRQLEREHDLSFGIYARVIEGGAISAGDPVALESRNGDGGHPAPSTAGAHPDGPPR